jgi:hypothetical protein
MNTVWIYTDTSKQVGDRDHLKVFASSDAADEWFEQNDPEGVAFEYEVLEWQRLAYDALRLGPAGSCDRV